MSLDSSNARLACIGGGNMARALLGGWLRQGWSADRITVSEPLADSRAALAREFGVQVAADNAAAAAKADVLLLAVKPQVLRAVCTALAPVLAGRPPLVVSIAAGVRVAAIAEWLGGQVPVVRCMPNTPALVGEGITALYAGGEVDAAQRAFTGQLLAAVGETVWIDAETQLDAVTAVSGSGPAYFFLLMEALLDGAIAQGLEPSIARRLVLKTAAGAASLALASEEAPGVLRQRVTSPGGTTQAALEVFEAGGLRATALAAVAAATRRGAELSQSS